MRKPQAADCFPEGERESPRAPLREDRAEREKGRTNTRRKVAHKTNNHSSSASERLPARPPAKLLPVPPLTRFQSSSSPATRSPSSGLLAIIFHTNNQRRRRPRLRRSGSLFRPPDVPSRWLQMAAVQQVGGPRREGWPWRTMPRQAERPTSGRRSRRWRGCAHAYWKRFITATPRRTNKRQQCGADLVSPARPSAHNLFLPIDGRRARPGSDLDRNHCDCGSRAVAILRARRRLLRLWSGFAAT